METKTSNNGKNTEYQDKPGGTFKKGNPGRPKGSQNLTTLVRKALKKIAKEQGSKQSYEKLLVQRILQKAIGEGDPKMIRLLWNYLDGMPPQPVKHSGDDDPNAKPIMIKKIVIRAPADDSNGPTDIRPDA